MTEKPESSQSKSVICSDAREQIAAREERKAEMNNQNGVW